MIRTAVLAAALAGLAPVASVSPTAGEAANAGCTIEQVGGTPRHRVRCRGGLVMTVEAGARYDLLDRNRNGTVDAVRVTGRAVLLDLPKGSAEGLEVFTPQAIAAVRGTRWAVDVGVGKTSVFVVEGSVGVRRASGGESAVLNPGDGVDVVAGSDPLTVRRWPSARVSALLSRFGQ